MSIDDKPWTIFSEWEIEPGSKPGQLILRCTDCYEHEQEYILTGWTYNQAKKFMLTHRMRHNITNY